MKYNPQKIGEQINFSLYCVSLPWGWVCPGGRSTGSVGGPHSGAYRTGKHLSHLQMWKTQEVQEIGTQNEAGSRQAVY